MSALSVFLFAALLLLFALVLRRDAWLLLLLYILTNKLLFLVPPEYAHIESVGELSDLALTFCCLFTVALPRYRRNLKVMWQSPIAKVIVLISALTLLVVIATVVRHGESFFYALRIGRVYFYYYFFFVIGCLLLGDEVLKKTERNLFVLSLGFSVVYIVQSVLPNGLLLHPSFVWEELSFAGMSLNRLYLDYLEFYAGVFVLVCSTALVLTKRYRALFVIGLIVFGMQVVVTRHRNLWLTVAIGLVVSLNTISSIRGFSLKRILFFTAISLIGFGLLFSYFGFLEGIEERVVEGIADTPLAGGTFTGRLIESEQYLTRIIDNFFVGVGFIHPYGGTLGTTAMKEYASELGNLGYVFHFGISGILIIALLVVAYRRSVVGIVEILGAQNPIRLSAVAGSYGYFWGMIFMSVLNGGLSMYSGIFFFSLVFAYTHVVGHMAIHAGDDSIEPDAVPSNDESKLPGDMVGSAPLG